jgi:hypothetical protein
VFLKQKLMTCMWSEWAGEAGRGYMGKAVALKPPKLEPSHKPSQAKHSASQGGHRCGNGVM